MNVVSRGSLGLADYDPNEPGTPDEMAARYLDRPTSQQLAVEFNWFRHRISGAKSILEIGSCFGHSMRMMSAVAARRAKLVMVDLGKMPDAAGRYAGADTTLPLRRTRKELKELGFKAHVIIGDSHDELTRTAVEAYAPYDVVFIDGDHTVDGVYQDWVDYGPMAKIVGFHDIMDHVAPVWKEIKARGYRTDEFCYITNGFGIGIVYKDGSHLSSPAR